jgi:3',5'-cyclic AMP phosphodiesterase CpdA
MNRRKFLTGAGLAAVLGTTNLSASLLGGAPQRLPRRKLRIAHLTDVHVMPIQGSPAQNGLAYSPAESFASALRHAQSLPDRPDLILNGGDCIMDALKQDKKAVKAQWNEWSGVLRQELDLPIISAIGNHDIWGWALPEGQKSPDDGKKWAMDKLELETRYYHVDKGGWRILVLDSSHFAPDSPRGYTAKLDEQQFDWLTSILRDTPPAMPVCVLSHIPILSFCPFLDGDNEQSGDWLVPGAWMHIDGRRIKDLFLKHPNVKVCLSGHVHLADELRYLGVHYCCNGAVSGGWWKGSYQEFPPAYYLVDLFDDGSATATMVPYLN